MKAAAGPPDPPAFRWILKLKKEIMIRLFLKPLIVAVVTLSGTAALAQPQGWHRTTDEDRAALAAWKACLAETKKPTVIFDTKQPGEVQDPALIGGFTLDFLERNNMIGKTEMRVDLPSARICMQQRGWTPDQ